MQSGTTQGLMQDPNKETPKYDEELFIKELMDIEGMELEEDEIECLRTLSRFEKKIDDVLTDRMNEIQEMFTKPSLRLKGILRLHLFAKYEDL